MSIIISDIKTPLEADDQQAIEIALKKANLYGAPASVCRRSIDLRHGQISRVFSVEIYSTALEKKYRDGKLPAGWRIHTAVTPPIPQGHETLRYSPVVIGAGPAGLFCALILAENGYSPIILERGASIDERDKKVEAFFNYGVLDSETNIQFGEGGAGAYSDGKINSRISNPDVELVLDIFEKHGVESTELQQARPHIGTDVLKSVVKSIRERIESVGGTIYFNTPARGFISENGRIKAVKTDQGPIPCDVCIMATGHSARDMYETLYAQGIQMEAKPFSVGLRIEHLQQDIDRAMYGNMAGDPFLPPGEYLLSDTKGIRGCYSFCMCPGGEVVCGASESGGAVSNGMSYHARSGMNANAAICVSVTPDDFTGVLGGMELQRRLERAAFTAAGSDYRLPVQKYGDFEKGTVSSSFTKVIPSCRRGWEACDLNKLLPEYVSSRIKQSMGVFSERLSGYNDPQAVLSGIETRTSAPVRILRDENTLESLSLQGLMPCGEGAGYAGGIMSAACDGIKCARLILERYKPMIVG